MYAQETVDRLAKLAKPRLIGLLRWKDVKYIYGPTPGEVNSKIVEDGQEFTLSKVKRATQPYRTIERFLSHDRVMQYIIDPGLLPLVTAMSKDILGRKYLATRRVSARGDDPGVTAHVEGFGVRIMMHFDESAADTIVTWECLYGVL